MKIALLLVGFVIAFWLGAVSCMAVLQRRAK